MRPYWRGYLKLSLVTCPIELSPATSESEKVRFHTVNKVTGNRIASRYVDAVTEQPVDEDDEVKGYERGENEYVLLEDDELDNIALESARTVDIDKFVPADSIGWIWMDTPYYVTPSDPVGEEAFAVIRDAMRRSGMVGVSRLVIGRRERACIIEPRDKGLVLWTLRFGDEVRDDKEYYAAVPEGDADPALAPLVAQLIKAQKNTWTPDMVTDPVQERLLQLISEKKKALQPKRSAKKKEAEPPPPNKVVNIMDALRKSIERERKAG